MSQPNSHGVLYAAVGERFVAEAIDSAATVRRHMPHLPIELWTDLDTSDLPQFDRTHRIENPVHGSCDKILPLTQTGFEKTLYLDTDTRMLQPVHELFELMDRFELGYCHAPMRGAPDALGSLSDAFPEPNSGMLIYRNTEPVLDLFHEWHEHYRQMLQHPGSTTRDQPALRRALFSSSIKGLVLPPEYNLRTIYPLFVGGGANAKILHGRGAGLDRAERWLSQSSRRVRVGDPEASWRKRLRFLFTGYHSRP